MTQTGQTFRDYVDTLLKGYSEEVYAPYADQAQPMTLEELIDSHREIRKARVENMETYRDGYSAGYEDAQNRYSMDNWIEISELRDMTIDELIEFLKNKDTDDGFIV